MISDVEHLFMYLLAICMSSLKKMSSSPLPIFSSSWVLGFVAMVLLLSCMSFLCFG